MTGLEQSVVARGIVLVLILVTAVHCELRTDRIPNALTLGGLLVALVVAAFAGRFFDALGGARLVRCALPAHASPSPSPECPMGTTASVSNDAWGPCVTPSLCACQSFERDCPHMQGYSEGCYQGHCGPWLH